MDASRFDTFTRALTATSSRRGALATLLGGTLGLLCLADTTARNKKGKRQGKKKKKGEHPTAQPPPPPPTDPSAPAPADPTAPPPPPCSASPCGSDASGLCYCRQPEGGGPTVCYKAEEQTNVGLCAECPANTACVASPQPGDFYCFKPCGAP